MGLGFQLKRGETELVNDAAMSKVQALKTCRDTEDVERMDLRECDKGTCLHQHAKVTWRTMKVPEDQES